MENHFSPTKFDSARSASVVDGTRLTANYTCTGRLWRASLSWKSGWERAQDSITAYDEASLKNAILKLDSTARFLGKVDPNTTPVETLADKTGEMLEALRVDPQTSDKAYISACLFYKQKPRPRTAPSNTAQVASKTAPVLSQADSKALEALRVDVANVSDARYRSACKNFGQPVQPRPTQAATPAAQALVPFEVQGDAWIALMQAHGEVFNTGPFVDQNITIVRQWLKDENRQSDAASLDQAYRELKAFACFRTANTLTRDLNGSLQIVRPYDHAAIVAARQQQTVEVATAPPDYLSDVERDCWQAVRQAYPKLAVGSPTFQDCCKRTLVKWATEFAVERQPELAAPNKRGELSVAVTKVLNAWAKISNPGMNRRVNEKGQEILWLG